MFGEEGFKDFYKNNLNLPPLEYQKFLESLKRPLPRTFRNLCLQKQVNISHLPFLLNSGFIYSQEMVSALPYKLMQLQPSHLVLDMCAAPGSKSTQIAQNVRLLVANEANTKRSNVLINNLKKTPSTRVVVTNHDASSFPTIRLPCSSTGSGHYTSPLYFDRILCDVPCSSDGTIRKDKKILDRWRLNTSLFSLQVRILKRAAKLLSSDGLIIYSTCSFNPIENEAVVQKFCTECFFEVVDCSKFPGVEIRFSNAVDCCMDGQLRDNADKSHTEALIEEMYKVTGESEIVKISGKFVFREGLTYWDPLLGRTKHTDDFFPKSNVNLRNCLRVMPHDQDTGGFFIAVLKRQSNADTITGVSIDDADIQKMIEKSGCNEDITGDVEANINSSSAHKKRTSSINMKFHLIEDALSSSIRKYYGLRSADMLVAQAQSKVVRSVSPLAFLVSNCQKLRTLSAGVRAFERNNFNAEGFKSYRISFEYAQLVWRQLDRALQIDRRTFMSMLDDFCQVDIELEGCAVFVHEGIVCPGFVNNRKGVLFMNKEIKEAVKRILD